METRPIRRALAFLSLVAAVVAATAPVVAQEAGGGLGGQVEALAARAGFPVQGLDRIGDAPARDVDEAAPLEQLETLLKGFNYLVVHDADGGVRELRILSRGPAPQPAARRDAVGTERSGGRHVVEAELTGPTGNKRTVRLVVDTGASTLVLPSSMIAPLGFGPDDLDDDEAETANGTVDVRVGTLRSVRVGQAEVRDVAVGFITDDRIGDQHLLGMSFLERFRLTIDPKTDKIVLQPR
ncbi:MAG: TIGR02281 family clan AA aspartic protease [Rhodospirillales bacterium]